MRLAQHSKKIMIGYNKNQDESKTQNQGPLVDCTHNHTFSYKNLTDNNVDKKYMTQSLSIKLIQHHQTRLEMKHTNSCRKAIQ
jgi:hypothetical protein